MTLETNKISVLLAALDFTPDVGQKTLVVAASAQEVEDVFKVDPHICYRTGAQLYVRNVNY